MALTLDQLKSALQIARRNLNNTERSLYSVDGAYPNPAYDELLAKTKRIEAALRLKNQIDLLNDPNASDEAKMRAVQFTAQQRADAEKNYDAFITGQKQLIDDVAGLTSQNIAFEQISSEKDKVLSSAFGEGTSTTRAAASVTSPKSSEGKPAATEIDGPPAPTKPAPTEPAPAPTKEDVKGLQRGVGEMKEQRNRMREIELEREEMQLAEEKAAQRQRAYNALTPAQKLELDVRSREQKQAERARAAVSERREQLAADEEYKGMQIASSGSFKRGDVTQYVDPEERAAAQSYFTNRAADIRAGENPAVRAEGGQFTAGPAPTFSGDRSLTVVDIDPRYGGGKGVGANPNFAGGVKFGSDPNTMAYEMIGGKPVPTMTVGQAYATQSRGPGINQYEKTGTLPQQLDAMSADRIRAAELKKKVDQMIGYQITGVLPPEVAKRAEADKKKREAEAAAAAAAAPKPNPSDPSQPYS
jgi:hypothetical protein